MTESDAIFLLDVCKAYFQINFIITGVLFLASIMNGTPLCFRTVVWSLLIILPTLIYTFFTETFKKGN